MNHTVAIDANFICTGVIHARTCMQLSFKWRTRITRSCFPDIRVYVTYEWMPYTDWFIHNACTLLLWFQVTARVSRALDVSWKLLCRRKSEQKAALSDQDTSSGKQSTIQKYNKPSEPTLSDLQPQNLQLNYATKWYCASGRQFSVATITILISQSKQDIL